MTKSSLYIVLGFGFLTSFAFAQGSSVDLQHKNRSLSFGYEYVRSGNPVESLYSKDYKYLFSLGVSLSDQVKNLEIDETDWSLFDSHVPIHFGFKVKFDKRFELGLSGSYTFVKPSLTRLNQLRTETGVEIIDPDASLNGPDDLELSMQYHFIISDHYSLSVMPFLRLPTGKESALLTHDSLGYGGLFIFDWNLKFAQIVLNAGFEYTSGAQLLVAKDASTTSLDQLLIDYQKRVHLGFGALIPLWGKELGLNLEVLRLHHLTEAEQTDQPTDVYLGLRSEWSEQLSLVAGAAMGNPDDGENRFLRFQGGVKYVFGTISEEDDEDDGDLFTEVEGNDQISDSTPQLETDSLEGSLDSNSETMDENNFSRDQDSTCPNVFGGQSNKARIFFNQGASWASPKIKLALKNLSDDINNYSDRVRSIEILGHASPDGPEAINLRISKKRADYVAKYIQAKTSVGSKKITFEGLGESQPLSSGRQSRRVEISVQLDCSSL